MFAHGKCPKRGVVWMTPWLWDAKLIYFQVSIRKYPSKHLQIPMEKPWKTYFLPVPHHIVEAPVQCCRPRPLPEQLQRDCFFNFRGAEGENKYNLVAKKAPVGSFSCKKKWPRTNLVATKAPVD
jgi:hypothetical protein